METSASSKPGPRHRLTRPTNGLIYGARVHGVRHGLRYVEIEVNNGLLRAEAAVAAKVTSALRTLIYFGPLYYQRERARLSSQ